jgi:hypothetical protein
LARIEDRLDNLKDRSATTQSRFVVSGIVLGACLDGVPGEPRIVHEDTEWLDIWVPEAVAGDLPGRKHEIPDHREEVDHRPFLGATVEWVTKFFGS